jgi:hypothetical protein
MLTGRLLGADQFHDIPVESGQAAIEAGQLRVMRSRQVDEIRVRYLSMADHATERHITVLDAVRPELVAWVFRQGSDHCLRG